MENQFGITPGTVASFSQIRVEHPHYIMICKTDGDDDVDDDDIDDDGDDDDGDDVLVKMENHFRSFSQISAGSSTTVSPL